MRLPVIQGTIKRRLLVNFRADPAAVQRLLPAPFRPKLHRGEAIVGLCLIRLEHIRPTGFPKIAGHSSENAAHRIAVTWNEGGAEREGVFIPRRDTGSILNSAAGGRIFPGEHHFARFDVQDDGDRIDFRMESKDGQANVLLRGEHADALPLNSRFTSLQEASGFFEGGSLGYSLKRAAGRLDGLRLRTLRWSVSALAIAEVRSSFFGDSSNFPRGSIEFDHALIMRDIPHEWLHEPEFRVAADSAAF